MVAAASVDDSCRVLMTVMAKHKTPARTSRDIGFTSPSGRTMISMPTNPIEIAIHRRGPTFSLKNGTLNAVMNSGAA